MECVMTSPFIPELRELTDKLSFSSQKTYSPNIRQNTMIRGTSLAFGLLNEPAVSCAKVFASSKSVFPAHSHNETEFFLVYNGTMEMAVEGETHVLNVGDCLKIDPNVEHAGSFPDGDCWFLAITIPQAEGWPDAPEGVQS